MEISNVHRQVCTAGLPLEEVLSGCSKVQQQKQESGRPQPEQALKCPRCHSTNTKFCYYNNYSLSQPRYFCKGCRRYWTKGGTLRNVPVGGACRKNKKSSSSSSSTITTTLASKRPPEQSLATISNLPLPRLIPPLLSYDPDGLTSPFARIHRQQHAVGKLLDDHEAFLLGNPNPRHVLAPPTGPSFIDILRTGFHDTVASPSSFNSIYYGYGSHVSADEEVVPPFNGGLCGATTTAATTVTTSCQGEMDEGDHKVFTSLQYQLCADGNMDNMDSGRDHCWNGVGSN